MELADKFQEGNPWPARDGQRVLFILDSRNAYERDLLRQWIHHHRASGSEEFEAPQVCLELGDDRKTIDTAQLIVALALPPDTLVAPLRVAWLPSQEDIDSGPGLRNLFFGGPRRPAPLPRDQSRPARARRPGPLRAPAPLSERSRRPTQAPEVGEASRLPELTR